MRVHGLEHIVPDRQYIFIANHQSNIDIPVLTQSLGRFQLRWIAKKGATLGAVLRLGHVGYQTYYHQPR